MSDNPYVPGTWVTDTGQELHRVHRSEQCEGAGCPLHHPSDHLMKNWPRHWNQDWGMMVRICKHGMHHPDPDSVNFGIRQGQSRGLLTEHDCDGCCKGVFHD